MPFGGTNSTLLRVALISIPLEAVSLYLFSFVPLDIGFPPGTNPLWYITLVGLFVHAPAMMVNVDRLPSNLVWPVLFLFGYFEIAGLSFALMFLYRRVKNLIYSE
jgi:hypothetical protein